MKIRYIVGPISVGINFLILAIITLKTGWLTKSQLELVSLITTALGFVVALIAVAVSYATLKSQNESSKESQNLVLLSQVTSEINEIKRALDMSTINNGMTKYYGNEAVQYYMNNYSIGNASPVNQARGFQVDFIDNATAEAYTFTLHVLSQLNKLTRLARDINSFPLNNFYRARAESNMVSTIVDYVKFYDQIFERVKYGLQGREMTKYDFNKSRFRVYLDIDREYDGLMADLKNMGYLSIVEVRQLNSAEFSDALEHEHEHLQARINQVKITNYQVNRSRQNGLRDNV